jgi:hypothetical protein
MTKKIMPSKAVSRNIGRYPPPAFQPDSKALKKDMEPNTWEDESPFTEDFLKFMAGIRLPFLRYLLAGQAGMAWKEGGKGRRHKQKKSGIEAKAKRKQWQKNEKIEVNSRQNRGQKAGKAEAVLKCLMNTSKICSDHRKNNISTKNNLVNFFLLKNE